ncbi:MULTISPECIES: hypothetical protein [Paenibacillus]|uniref:hypothetical protein n=1 Tax=Paenibacillus TaxID=44249 RepID=UPI00096F4179|nr:hypothetical protein [Paenibacillus odorifer]OMD81169.1 hypothetical protein BSK53_19320 [Paenibacillus odorifer]
MKSKKQFIIHIVVYFIEIVLFTSLIIWIIEGLNFNNRSFIDIIKQYVFAYTLYQLIIIAIFKFKDSVEIDALTSIKSLIDKFQIYAEFNIEIPESNIEDVRVKLLENDKVTMKNEHKVLVGEIIKQVEKYKKGDIGRDYFRFIMKQESREVETKLKIFSFHWMNSIFLRVLK